MPSESHRGIFGPFADFIAGSAPVFLGIARKAGSMNFRRNLPQPN
jgi:type IV secretory pathway VirB2 component (pilin)